MNNFQKFIKGLVFRSNWSLNLNLEPEIEPTVLAQEEVSSQSSLATDPGPSPSELDEENISFSNDEEEKTIPGLSEDEKEEENKEEEKDDELNEMLDKANEKKKEEEVAKERE